MNRATALLLVRPRVPAALLLSVIAGAVTVSAQVNGPPPPAQGKGKGKWARVADGADQKPKKGKPAGPGDEPEPKGDRGEEDETGQMLRLRTKAVKAPETEREKVLQEVEKLPPGGPPGEDPGGWFDRLAGGADVWVRAGAGKAVGQVFDRVTARLGLPGDRVTRADFRAYARAFLGPDGSPPWKPAEEPDWDKEAEKLFRKLDRDGDGALGPAEQPDALRADPGRWDANRDGVIDRGEYLAYFPDRFRAVARQAGATGGPGPAPPPADRPFVPRAGSHPPGTPAWFDRLDFDRDGQVGLYEWRRVWPAREFVLLDTNGDGFLTAGELGRHLAAGGPARLPLVADLARRPVPTAPRLAR